jgi:serine/threonine-protein kinase
MDSKPSKDFPRRFGSRYVLLKELARGGMGQILLASNGGRICAIKTLHPEEGSESVARRFLDEARLATQLSHPNLVYVSEAGTVDDVQYMAMEYVRGRDLHQVLQRCRETNRCIPTGLALYIAKELLRGLGYLHGAKGLDLVHRDVAPSNVLISDEGSLKIIDLGLAKWNARLAKTALGPVVGQVAYASPEQRLGDAVDHRSDIYSVGMILWEMVTNQSSGAGELPCRVIPVVPPPSKVAPELPRALDDLIMTALASDRSNRYQSAQDFIAALAKNVRGDHDGDALRAFLREMFGNEIRREDEEEAGLVASADPLVRASACGSSTTAEMPGASQPEPRRRAGNSLRLGATIGILAAVAVGGGALAMRSMGHGSALPTKPTLSGSPKAAPHPDAPVPSTPAVALPPARVADFGSAGVASQANGTRATPERQVLAAAQIESARIMHSRGRNTEAIALAQEALSAHTHDIEAHLLLGRIYLQLGNQQEAGVHFRTVLDLAPGHPVATHALATGTTDQP